MCPPSALALVGRRRARASVLPTACLALWLAACGPRAASAAPDPAIPDTISLRADSISVEKGQRRMTLFLRGEPVRTYRIALGLEPVGPKLCQGDLRTPEGAYVIDARNPNSGFHRSLHVSYPGPDDIARAREAGCQPGGDIMIHGIKNGYGWLGALHADRDWTLGCIAVTDEEIEEIWSAVPDGTPVVIVP